MGQPILKYEICNVFGKRHVGKKWIQCVAAAEARQCTALQGISSGVHTDEYLKKNFTF
jgi:hypothetical protein